MCRSLLDYVESTVRTVATIYVARLALHVATSSGVAGCPAFFHSVPAPPKGPLAGAFDSKIKEVKYQHPNALHRQAEPRKIPIWIHVTVYERLEMLA